MAAAHEQSAASDRRPVLVVEDDLDIGECVRQLLEDEGYPVLWAQNGREAMELIARERPCLILLDLMMPVMNGWQVLEALRHDVHLAPLPVVVTSAVGSTGVEGSHTLLRKPYELDQVLSLVREYCSAEAPSPTSSR